MTELDEKKRSAPLIAQRTPKPKNEATQEKLSKNPNRGTTTKELNPQDNSVPLMNFGLIPSGITVRSDLISYYVCLSLFCTESFAVKEV